MSDDETDDLGEIQTEPPTDSMFYETDTGYLIFPHGEQWFAETYDFSAIRITYKTGEIEGMDALTGSWRKPAQRAQNASVRTLRPVDAK